MRKQYLHSWNLLTIEERQRMLFIPHTVVMTDGISYIKRKIKMKDNTAVVRIKRDYRPVWPIRTTLKNGISYITFRLQK